LACSDGTPRMTGIGGYDLADPADRVFAFDYEHSGRLGDPMPELLLPATTAGRIDGEPLEDVLLARDDVAALAWGIEHVLAGAAGRPLDRAQAAAERRRRRPGGRPADWGTALPPRHPRSRKTGIPCSRSRPACAPSSISSAKHT
jgi:hypothetical protein